MSYRIHDHAPMYCEEFGICADLPDGLAELLGKVECPNTIILDWNGGEVWECAMKDRLKPQHPYVRFTWIDHDTQFEDGTIWLNREFVVEGHWNKVKGMGYKCVIIDLITEVFKDGTSKVKYERT